ncbi:MAG TPA: hypothetical protein VMT29_21940 [Steroidobacteraceae bacterium]|nr:hypothetical protein [Steroidobacteraceae bacterium]
MLKRMPLIVATLFAVTALASAAIGAEAEKTAAATTAPADAQFGGQCVEGLAQGQHILTSCSVTWTDKDGKLYCFKSDAAKSAFLQSPQDNLERARAFVAADAVQSTEQAMQNYESADAETLVKSHIESAMAANGGVYPHEDELTGEPLKLAFDGIDFTRTIDGYGFFPDVKFHVQSDADKKYLIDYWVVPEAGQLQIREIRIYRAPEKVDGKWQAVTRQPVPWWWIPASEHPGHMAEKRSWEVMSAVEDHALRQTSKSDGIFRLKDDKTGQDLALRFVDTHQPIRKLDEDGHYFACTDFRVAGTKDQIYDIDFWLTEKDGKMVVDKTRVHKVPQLKNGQWIQVPRYSFKDLGESKVVP